MSRSKNSRCLWDCGGTTGNVSGICDSCWHNREQIYKARKARDAKTAKANMISAKIEAGAVGSP